MPRPGPARPASPDISDGPVPPDISARPVRSASPAPPATSARPVPPDISARPVRSASPAPPVRQDTSARPVRPASAPLAALALLLACAPPPEPPGPAAKAAARELWQTRCANCHGQDGRGDGPTGRALTARPRDFHDPAWQSSATDDHLRRTIVEGGHSVGLSRDMTANADLDGRPAVVDELVAIVRGFAPR